MQRKYPSAAAPPAVGGEYEVVNLLHTDLRDEYKQPPLVDRIKGFVLQNYTVHNLVPATRWIPEYLGRGPGGWRAGVRPASPLCRPSSRFSLAHGAVAGLGAVPGARVHGECLVAACDALVPVLPARLLTCSKESRPPHAGRIALLRVNE